MNLGMSIKKIRESNGMKQAELAEKIGVTQSMLCQIERGSKIPSVLLSIEIASALNCTINDLIEGL